MAHSASVESETEPSSENVRSLHAYQPLSADVLTAETLAVKAPSSSESERPMRTIWSKMGNGRLLRSPLETPKRSSPWHTVGRFVCGLT